jgi:CheY-like chemotaxis protein
MKEKSVLVVDSCSDTLECIRQTLEGSGFTVLTAEGCDEAAAIADRADFSILLCEPVLKDGNGAQLLNRLSRKRSFEAIALSASGFAHQRESFRKDGFSHFLLKPVSEEQLLRLINKLS